MRVYGVKCEHLSKRELKRLKYTLEFINEHPYARGIVKFGVNNAEGSKIITYGQNPGNETPHINSSLGMFKSGNRDDIRMTHVEYKSCDYHFITAISEAQNNESISKNRIHYDLFSTIFFFISRIEEVDAAEHKYDDLRRFKSDECLLVKFNIEKYPVVDMLVELLLRWLNFHRIDLRKFKWIITHDLDEIKRFTGPSSLLRSWIGTILRKENILNIKKLTQAYFSNKDPYDNFDILLNGLNDLEKVLFIPATAVDKNDPQIHIYDTMVEDVILTAKENNYLIGLHGGIQSAREINLLNKDIVFLNDKYGITVERIRFHYLSFDWSITPLLLSELDIKYDYSIGWSDRIGYRSGTGVCYKPYDLHNEQSHAFYERPLVCMDIALLRESKWSEDNSRRLIDKLLSRPSPEISINFHNSTFFAADLLGFNMIELYDELLITQ